MFGRDPRLLLAELFQHRLRYLGNDETVLSLQALWNMYLIIAENLCKARQKDTTGHDRKITSIQPNQLVTLIGYPTTSSHVMTTESFTTTASPRP